MVTPLGNPWVRMFRLSSDRSLLWCRGSLKRAKQGKFFRALHSIAFGKMLALASN